MNLLSVETNSIFRHFFFFFLCAQMLIIYSPFLLFLFPPVNHPGFISCHNVCVSVRDSCTQIAAL